MIYLTKNLANLFTKQDQCTNLCTKLLYFGPYLIPVMNEYVQNCERFVEIIYKQDVLGGENI